MIGTTTAAPTAASNVPRTVSQKAEARALLDEGVALERAGKVDQAVEVLLRALGLLSDEDHQPLTADLLYKSAVLRTRLGQTDAAEDLFHQSLEAATWCTYVRGQAWAVNGLAIIAQRKGNTELAESQFRRARRLASEVSEHRLLGILEMNLGVIANIRGDLDSALVHYESSLAAFQQTEDLEATCWALNNIGMLNTDLRRYDEADETFARGLKISKKTGDRVMEGLLEVNRVEALIGLQRWRKARSSCRRVMKLAGERGDTIQQGQAWKFLAIVSREQGDARQSIDSLDQAAELAQRAGDELLGAEVLRERGEVYASSEDWAEAHRCWEQALGRFEDLDAVLDAADLRLRLEETAAPVHRTATPPTGAVS